MLQSGRRQSRYAKDQRKHTQNEHRRNFTTERQQRILKICAGFYTKLNSKTRGRNSSLVVFGLAVHSVAGSILLWGHFPVQGIFPLELTWVQTPFPPKKTLSDESINRGLVCAHMHFIARTQKILTFMS